MKILFPTSVNGEVKLAKGIDVKTTSDGVTGELHQFNIDHSISPHANYLGGLVSLDKYDLAKQADKDGKKWNQKWKVGLKDPIKWIEGIGQSLKVDNKPLYTVLGDWGFFITPSGKIIYDKTNLGWQTLGNAIVTKYGLYAPGTAPIERYIVSQNFTILELEGALTATDGFKTNADTAYNSAKADLQLANNVIASIRADDHLMAEKLVVLHPEDSQHLTEYTYDTNMANSSEIEQTSTILPGEEIVVSNAKEGTTIEKLTGGDVTITPGMKLTAVPKPFPTSNKLNVDKGMSRFRVKNNDALLSAKIKTTILRKKRTRGK